MQAQRCEELGLLRFGRTKVDPRKRPEVPVLTPSEQEAAISGALNKHMCDIKEHLRGARTQANIERMNGDFEVFLRQFSGHPAGTWHECTPELVLVFLTTVIAARRGRDGAELAASTLRQLVSNLSMCFNLRGRSKPWDDLAAAGNPVQSRLVREHVAVVERRQHASGVRAQSAVPSAISDVQQVLASLDRSEAAATAAGSKLDRLRLARDACMLALLWHSCRRAADLLRLTWGHMYSQSDQQLVSVLWHRSATLPDAVLITADVLKNAKRERPLTIVVKKEEGPSSGLSSCAIARLRHLFDVIRAEGESCCSGDFIFCSYDETLAPRPRPRLESTAYANRFRAQVDAVFPRTGSKTRTVHGVRRGRMQHEASSGASLPEVMRLAGISTESVAHKYLDPGRHLP